ncbi:hypothetical protein ACIQU6_19925 [Streptomyces sp. NPDC090442]|uniref:DUF7617 domain-containing protein n=1 Tax=Streptomyces sp. NPDC090442 TaxID=3365962 RepID=UPI0037FCCBAD
MSTDPITVLTHVTLLDDSAFHTSGSTLPTVVVTFDGPPAQVCFQTKVAENCAVTEVSNQVKASSDSTATVSSNKVTLQVKWGADCERVIKKEVCDSEAAGDCGEDGPGPWVESTRVPSGGTVFWRITVTNPGGSTFTGMTLNDAVAESCEKAAETFDLAPHQERKFFCSNSDITESTTNTVTASYVPPASPPNMPSSTTPPASASAAVGDGPVLPSEAP